MIRVDLSDVQPTARLLEDQAKLDEVPDAVGPALVKHRGDAGWTGLRDTLWSAQHGKCAYCEDYLREAANEIDHIRPKGQTNYWWLAFAVRNLLLACRTCNNAKRNHFDVQAGVSRLAPHELPWEVDEPAMLVDPTWEEPSEHLTYVFLGGRWRIAAANDSERGSWTIQWLKLDRMSFSKAANRFIRLAVDPLVVRLQTALEAHDRDEIRAVTKELTALTLPDQEWSQLMQVVVSSIREQSYPGPPVA